MSSGQEKFYPVGAKRINDSEMKPNTSFPNVSLEAADAESKSLVSGGIILDDVLGCRLDAFFYAIIELLINPQEGRRINDVHELEGAEISLGRLGIRKRLASLGFREFFQLIELLDRIVGLRFFYGGHLDSLVMNEPAHSLELAVQFKHFSDLCRNDGLPILSDRRRRNQSSHGWPPLYPNLLI